MKISIYLLFIILAQTLYGQITYKPIFINQCTKEVENNVYWYLTDSSKTYGIENYESKSINLTEAGFYNLHTNFNDPPITIEISSNKINRDTIFLKRLELVIYVSNPPHSEYFDCGKLANGEIVDFYANGNIRTKGKFKEGQPIDTLFEYHRNGMLSEQFIPRKKWKNTTFYNNGQIKSVCDTKKKIKKEYYRNGQLKSEEYWNRKYTSKLTEFDEKGNIIKTANKKEQKKFNKSGIVIEKIHRKEILVFDRIFAKDKYHRNNKFYEYKWEIFDEKGLIKKRIVFNRHEFFMSAFPDSLKQVEEFSFDKILFYEDGTESKKIEFKYVYEDNNYTKKMIVYRKENDEWTEEKITTANNVYKQLEL